MKRNLGSILRKLAYGFYTMGVLLVVAGLVLSATFSPAKAASSAYIVFDSGDYHVCMTSAGTISVSGTVHLPSGISEAVLVYQDYVVFPYNNKDDNYDQLTVHDGDRFTIDAYWPGMGDGVTFVEIHIGANLYVENRYGYLEPIGSAAAGLDVYSREENCEVENTPTPTLTNTPEDTATPTLTNTPENTATPTSTNTPENTATPTLTNTPEDTATPTITNTPENTATPTLTNTPENTPTYTATVEIPTLTLTPDQPPTATATEDIATATNTPEVPTNTPEAPTNTPENPTNTPEVPTNTPEAPTNTPEGPTNTPELPTNTPEVPTNTPEVPTNTPESPTNTPDTPPGLTVTPPPMETPEVPTDVPTDPTDVPAETPVPTLPAPPDNDDDDDEDSNVLIPVTGADLSAQSAALPILDLSLFQSLSMNLGATLFGLGLLVHAMSMRIKK
jgi:hypothetical protein